ncbi:MAG: ATP synthase F1 subunit epsilon [Actinobacteria bacterium]|nr:ATP synthase F1 subunit epsilon [Actinomycetota bacterium]
MALEIHLVTPEREVWAGSAEMVIARGTAGEVGILSGHAPLLIRLAIGVLRIQLEGGAWERVVVDGGFLHVTTEEGATRVDVLATHAEMAGDVDRAAAQARARELRERAGDEDEPSLKAQLASATVRAELGE